MTIGYNYFMVKINKEEQRHLKEHVSKGSILYMPAAIGNSRNMECGEIVQIGEGVEHVFENARVGDTLIFDWIIEGNHDETRLSYFLFSDAEYNYYAVDEPNVKGLYNGDYVTPYKTFIFLKNVSAFPALGELDEATGLRLKKNNSGLFEIVEWKESAQDIAQKVEFLKKQIDSLAKSTRTEAVQKAIWELSVEMNKLNRKAQKKAVLPYRLAYSNKIVDRNFGRKLKEDDILYCDNWACRYITNFKNKEYSYIVCPINNIGFLYIPQNKKLENVTESGCYMGN